MVRFPVGAANAHPRPNILSATQAYADSRSNLYIESTTQNYISPFTIASCFRSSNSGCPILPPLLFFLATARVTIPMIPIVELVEVDRSGISGREYLLSRRAGECAMTYLRRGMV